jgi:4-amino-4-deoxy-L-arabinose transferase-like glycosyltransferase
MKLLIKKTGQLIKRHRWLLMILLINLGLRMIFIFLFSHWDEGEMMDSSRYQRVALNILEGRGFTEWRIPTAFSPPLYPYVIAGIIEIFGSAVPVKIIQVLLSVLTGVCIYWMGLTVFNRRTGLTAAFLFAISPEIVVLSGSLYTETLYIFLSTLAFALLSQGIKVMHNKFWMLSGFFLALAILTRHILILFPFWLLVVTAVIPALRPLFRQCFRLAVVCLLLLVPWIVRNYVVFDQFVPIASGAGGGLWHGSNLSNKGQYQYDLSRQTVAEQTRGLERPVDKDRELLNQSFHAILQSPVRYSLMVARKFFRFFTQVYEDIPRGERRKTNLWVQLTLIISYYPVLLGCLAGLFLSRRQWRLVFPLYSVILYSGLIYSVTLVTPRYRIPLIPFMIIFTGLAFTALWERISEVKQTWKKNPEIGSS